MLNLDEVTQHSHNVSRNSFIRKDNILAPVPAPTLSATPGVSCINKPFPLCGEHTSEILESIGYSQTEINILKKNNVVFEEKRSKI